MQLLGVKFSRIVIELNFSSRSIIIKLVDGSKTKSNVFNISLSAATFSYVHLFLILRGINARACNYTATLDK